MQSHGLDSVGTTSDKQGRVPIITELVQGTKEKIYWEKVPDNVKAQLRAKAQAAANGQPEATNVSLVREFSSQESTHRKRRKRG